MAFETVLDNYKIITEKIEKAKLKANRTDDVRLMAVTKTVPPEKVNAAISAGTSLLGENRVQELLAKYEAYDKSAEIHLIGSLQTNKVKYIADKVTMIQSVDSLKLADEINKHAGKLSRTMDILIQVNIGREQSKGGVLPETLDEMVFAILEKPNLRLRGLMAIPPIGDTEKYFPMMQKIFVDIQSKKVDNSNMRFDTLSMGMSDDYEQAILFGANIVRIGSLLFGYRN